MTDEQHSHPGVEPHGHIITAPVSLLDLVPALLDLAGVDRKAMPVLHGFSLVPDLRGEARADRPVFCEMDKTKMIRQGAWKYSADPEFEFDQLFNLDDDPDELNNLARDPAQRDRVEAFRSRILHWMINTQNAPMPRCVTGPSGCKTGESGNVR
jgi:choline-sulfatase